MGIQRTTTHTRECVVDMDLQPQGQVFSLQQPFKRYLFMYLAALGLSRSHV